MPEGTAVADHFEKVERDPETGCLIWTGTTFWSGYGRIGDKRAHRVAYERAKGPIPDGLFVCHQCDNPRCVNPEHLFLGTTDDNMADMVAKGRSARGERHGRAKITADEASEIRESSLTCREAARHYGISKSMVSYIRQGVNWK